MLDDQQYITRFDSDDALGVAAEQFSQLAHGYELDQLSGGNVSRVLVAGMGGSALAADYIPVIWPEITIPYAVSRSYTLPGWVDGTTLVVISSYSGNTEEILAVLEAAQQRQAQIVVMSSGGALAEQAADHSHPYLQIPSGVQPRMSYLYQLKALATILDAWGVTQDAVEQLQAAGQTLGDIPRQWTASVPTEQNQAKQLAEHLAGKTPVIYGGILYPAAYKWKISCNENAKNTAWCGQYSEFNHNEFLGWSSHPIEKPFGVVDLISSFDHPQVQKRFALTDKLLSGKRPKALQIAAEGESLLEQLLWVTALGDMVSIYLAILNGVNPTPVELIEKFKKELTS